MKDTMFRRVMALLLALVLVAGYIPASGVAAEANPDLIETIADPETLTRPSDIYGSHTKNAGKVTVGKSVAAGDGSSPASVALENNITVKAEDLDNFLVTITQTAQVMGLASESAVPLDVVFVLDTSGSMNQDNVNRAASMVTAANSAIATLMAANEHNRVGVVAFSSNGYGGGTSNNAAANVLSSLDHYTGTEATAHLTWVNSDGNATGSRRNYIAGRDQVNRTRASRHGHDGGTNIQAGIITGAKLLTAESNVTTVQTEDGLVTRMPFLVVLSDGQPTYTYSSDRWYDPDSSTQQGPGGSSYAGNGFITATTAAYYKSLITEKYYGDKASSTSRCYIYTIGVQLTDELGQITMDPAAHFVTDSSNDYYRSFNTYWTNFTKTPTASFSVLVDQERSGGFGGRIEDVNYTYTAAAINATRDRVLGKSSTGKTMYTGGLAYNDDYFAATSTSDIADAFNQVISSIQEKAISAPTKVTEAGSEFSGYVNFYDTLGEYMEVKDMKGIIANGNFYRGTTFTELLRNPGTNAEFDATLRHMLSERLVLSESDINVDDFIEKAAAANDGTNSICWWGKEHNVGEEDIHMQVLGNADSDSIEYIQTATDIPQDAQYVCRSYFYYGTAGNTVDNPNHEYLYFVIRVQRSLQAPYQQTVVISCPASLLSMDKVSVTEDVDGNYTAKVEKNDPARVVYEVGLRSDITAQNVKDIVSADYANEKTVGEGAVNYDPATDTYYFFTNDWNRAAEAGEHQRALTKATFDAAADNSYYAYQEDTPLLVQSGSGYVPYTGAEPAANQTFYYARTYYSWEGKTPVDGVYPVTQETAYIPVTIPEGVSAHEHILQDETTKQWYVKKGTYTSATTVDGDETHKLDNTTGTAANVKYVRNTTNMANSHYTVMLGNNGLLSLKADKTKEVSGQRGTAVLKDGSVVMVGDELTYSIKVVNNDSQTATANVTDSIPKGTEYVAGSASHNGTLENGVMKWTLSVPANSFETVSFKVKVTEKALDAAVLGVDNTATVSFANGPSYTTNTTHNPPSGKLVEGATSNVVPESGIQVGDELIYRIRYTNDTDSEADITITDKIPTGTYYLENTASHGGQPDGNGNLVWTIEGVAPGTGGIVSFRVVVHPGAKTPLTNTATIQIGPNGPSYDTNPVETEILSGNLTLSKDVVVPAGYPDATDHYGKEFTLLLKELGPHLNGAYSIQTGDSLPFAKVFFENGVAYEADSEGNKQKETQGLTIKHGQSFTILDLPAGANFSVSEVNALGYAATLSGSLLADGTVDIPKNGTAAVQVTNTYSLRSASVNLEATKTLTGRTLYDNEFSFVVLEGQTQVASASNDGTKITFSPITYTAKDIGTHTYTVKELTGTLTNVKYDTTEYTVTVAVTDNGDGTLGTRVTYPEGGVKFENTYTPSEVSVNLELNKILHGRDLKAGEFSFQVKDANGKVVATGTNAAANKGAAAKIAFSTIGFKEAGTYSYTVTEVIPDVGRDPYMRYDKSEIKVTVTVTYDANTGVLTPSVTYPADVTFENTQFPSSISVTPAAGKATTGNQVPTDTTFSFTVLRSDENGTAGEEVGTGLGSTNGQVTFSKLYFTQAGTYWYLLKETHAGQLIHGIRYDDSAYLMKVVVTMNDGQLTAAEPVYYKQDGSAWVETSTVQFHNDYDAKGQLTITAGKELTGGRNLGVGDFAFKLVRQGVNNHEIAGVLTDVSGKTGTVTFATLYYDLEEFAYTDEDTVTVEYKMSEVIPSTGKLPGVTYDGTEHTIEVTLTHNADGTITARVTKVDGYATDSDTETGVVFENSYAPQDTSVVIEATKELTGRKLTTGEFAFKLFHITDSGEKLVDTATNGANGKIQFHRNYYAASFPFDGGNEATVEYVLREVNGGLGGVTYSGKAYRVTVTVTHDPETGKLRAEVTYPDGTPVFENSYSAQGTTYTPVVKKELTGRDINQGEFTFQVTPKGMTEAISVGQVQKDGSVRFSAIGFNQAGTYTYAITEVPGNLGGVEYSKATYYLKVTVDDDGSGQLKVTEAKYYSDEGCTQEVSPVFTNKYTPEPVSVNLRAWKRLTNKVLAENEFSFTLTGQGQNQTATNQANGLVAFETIIYSAPGTYTYTVKEVTGSNTANYVYDEGEYTVTVLVTDNGLGQLLAQVSYEKGGAAAQSMEFVNKYQPSPMEMDLTQKIGATKTVLSDALDYRLTEGEFQFSVRDIRNTVINTGKNDASGNIVFDKPFRFETAGIYTYWIMEDASQKPGITTDSRNWRLQIQVRYDETKGQLYILEEDVITVNQSNVAEAPAFVNRYDPTPATATISAHKTLVGRELASGDFLFQLKQGDVVRDEVRNGGEGHIHFNLHYDKVGTYEYTVVEVNEGKPGYDYDTNVETVTVVVTNNQEEGKLEAQVTYGDSQQLFENTYTIADGGIVIPGVKAYRDSKDQPKDMEQFSFGLYQGSTLVATAKNDGITGTIGFYLPYKKADIGEHTYTMREIPGSDPCIDYDPVVYTVTVKVADNGKGGLDITYAIDGQENATAEFENVYQIPDPAQVTVNIQKIIDNKSTDDIGLDGFQIDLDLEGVKAKDVTDKEGKASFKLQFFEEHVGQTFTVKVSEKKGDRIGVSYDTTVHTLQIQVVRNDDGTLGTVIDGEEANSTVLSFVNTYYGKGSPPPTGDTTQLLLPLGLMLISIAGMGLLLLLLRKNRYKGKHSA